MATHKTLRILAGLVWLVVGFALLRMGLVLLAGSSVAWIATGLGIGYLKGKFILSKSAKRAMDHISKLPQPSPIWKVFSGKFLMLIALMMGLGISLRIFHAPDLLRGVVLTAVGAALMQGAIRIFRMMRAVEATT